MSSSHPSSPEHHELEGDYRPVDSAHPTAHLDPVNVRVEAADLSYLARLADALNTTLDLQTMLERTSELVRAVIEYRIFAIFLLNDRTHDLRMRFQIGHSPQTNRTACPSGEGASARWPLHAKPSFSTMSPPPISTSPRIPKSAPSWPYP